MKMKLKCLMIEAQNAIIPQRLWSRVEGLGGPSRGAAFLTSVIEPPDVPPPLPTLGPINLLCGTGLLLDLRKSLELAGNTALGTAQENAGDFDQLSNLVTLSNCLQPLGKGLALASPVRLPIWNTMESIPEEVDFEVALGKINAI